MEIGATGETEIIFTPFSPQNGKHHIIKHHTAPDVFQKALVGKKTFQFARPPFQNRNINVIQLSCCRYEVPTLLGTTMYDARLPTCAIYSNVYGRMCIKSFQKHDISQRS